MKPLERIPDNTNCARSVVYEFRTVQEKAFQPSSGTYCSLLRNEARSSALLARPSVRVSRSRWASTVRGERPISAAIAAWVGPADDGD